MTLFRPEATAFVTRWREALIGVAVAVLGLWWALTAFAILFWLGLVLVGIGTVVLWTGVQRARFGQGRGGPGVVQIVERRLSYFGPLTGGIIDIDDIRRLDLEPQAYPAPHWLLTGADGSSLAIPVNAEGAEALFDVFATLPGIRTEQMLDLLRRHPPLRVTVWQAAPRRLH